jgi:hypothetical protein
MVMVLVLLSEKSRVVFQLIAEFTELDILAARQTGLFGERRQRPLFYGAHGGHGSIV